MKAQRVHDFLQVSPLRSSGLIRADSAGECVHSETARSTGRSVVSSLLFPRTRAGATQSKRFIGSGRKSAAASTMLLKRGQGVAARQDARQGFGLRVSCRSPLPSTLHGLTYNFRSRPPWLERSDADPCALGAESGQPARPLAFDQTGSSLLGWLPRFQPSLSRPSLMLAFHARFLNMVSLSPTMTHLRALVRPILTINTRLSTWSHRC